MVSVRPVALEDFDKVFPLLQKIPSPIPISKDSWLKLFNKQWSCQLEPLGYVLLDDTAIVGFISLITTKREICGKQHEIVDLTSWSVDKRYGAHSIKLLFPFIQNKEKTFRCFTPAKSVDVVFRKFGFQELSAVMQIIPFWCGFQKRAQGEIVFDVAGNQSRLLSQEQQIYADHGRFSNHHFIIKRKDKNCYVVAKRVCKKRLPFLHVHYVGDKELFIETIQQFSGVICRRSKTLGLIVFDHVLGRRNVPGAIRRGMTSKPLFRSHNLKVEDIDSLYSEFFVLDF